MIRAASSSNTSVDRIELRSRRGLATTGVFLRHARLVRRVLLSALVCVVGLGCGASPAAEDAGRDAALADASVASDAPAVDAPFDAMFCARLDTASARLIAGGTPADAPELGLDVATLVTSPSGGFVAVRTTRMHTTLAVVALEAPSLELTNALGVAVGDASDLSCDLGTARRIEHHSHTPSTFYVRVPAGETRVRFITD